MILTFCSIDVIILTIWYLKDPMYLQIENFPLVDPDIIDEDIKVCQPNPIMYECLTHLIQLYRFSLILNTVRPVLYGMDYCLAIKDFYFFLVCFSRTRQEVLN